MKPLAPLVLLLLAGLAGCAQVEDAPSESCPSTTGPRSPALEPAQAFVGPLPDVLKEITQRLGLPAPGEPREGFDGSIQWGPAHGQTIHTFRQDGELVRITALRSGATYADMEQAAATVEDALSAWGVEGASVEVLVGMVQAYGPIEGSGLIDLRQPEGRNVTEVVIEPFVHLHDVPELETGDVAYRAALCAGVEHGLWDVAGRIRPDGDELRVERMQLVRVHSYSLVGSECGDSLLGFEVAMDLVYQRPVWITALRAPPEAGCLAH